MGKEILEVTILDVCRLKDVFNTRADQVVPLDLGELVHVNARIGNRGKMFIIHDMVLRRNLSSGQVEDAAD